MVVEGINPSSYLTLGALVITTYKKNYLNTYHLKKRIGEKEIELITKCTFGGGVEVYKSHGKKVNVYDVNSQYTTSMLNAISLGKPI